MSSSMQSLILSLWAIGPLPALASGPSADTSDLLPPPFQACLPAPDLAQVWLNEDPFDEADFFEPGAPSSAELGDAMADFSPLVVRCLSPGKAAVGDLELELVVACTGRVSASHITNDGGLEPELIECIEGLLPYAVFPAHGVPDGYRFRYLMRIWYPTGA